MKLLPIGSVFIGGLGVVFSNPGYGASFGDPADDPLQSSATICMAVGARAALTGFDNFRLEPVNTDGPAGSLYAGSDSFELDSNAPVRVIIEGEYLNNGEHEIDSWFSIDGNRNHFDTSSEGAHKGVHTFSARAQLGRISEQAAGDYSSVVTLTVTPQMGGMGGCGEFSKQFNTVDGWATLAFEDLYPHVGDGDYNDMVVRYHVQENYNDQNELENVSLEFEPLARGAGYIHSFNLSLDGQLDKTRNATAITPQAFNGDALISVTYTNANGASRKINGLDKEDDITIFNNTRSALDGFANVYDNKEWVTPKMTARVDITLANPELNLYSDRGKDSLFWYRPFLSVNNTNKDIDLAVVNPDNGMIDNNGNPFGLFVPVTWEWPLERSNIFDAYPHFGEYTAFLNGEISTLSTQAEEWYNYPSDAAKVINLDNAELSSDE